MYYTFFLGELRGSKIEPETPLSFEIVEIPEHRFFIGAQFHPELKSKVLTPHPIFIVFIKAAIDYSQEK